MSRILVIDNSKNPIPIKGIIYNKKMIGKRALPLLQRNALSVFMGFCLLTVMALAAHDATTSSGATTFTAIEDSVTLFNITINNSDINQNANISSVTVTIPASFTFSSGSQNTSANANHAFTNSGTLLNWTNTSFYLINGSGGNDPRYFWFNATAATPGTFSLIVTTTNGTATFNPRNLTVNVNDTTAPTFFYVYPGNNTATRSSTINISGNFSDNFNLTRLILYVWNSSNILVNSTIINTSLTSLLNGLANFTFTFPREDRYFINFLMNDTANNSAFNSTNFTLIYDTTAPPVSLSKSSSTKTSLTLSITASDGLAGMNSSCAVSGRSGASVSGTGSSQTITESNLSCSTSYTYDVSCTDAASNTGTASSSFSTDSCGAGEKGVTSGSGRGSTAVNWSNTFVPEAAALTQGYTRELAAKERVKVVVANKDHHVGVLEVTNTTIKIQITSSPQEAVLSIGESKRFEVTNDSIYDLKVTLFGITNLSKANLTIQTIEEPIPANETQKQDVTGVAEEQRNATAQNASASQAGSTRSTAFRVILIVILVIVIVLIAFLIWMWKKRSS